MSVEEVDMAVPVAGVRPSGKSTDGPAGATAMLADGLRVAASTHRRPAFTPQQRRHREREFDSVSKRLAKQLSSQLAAAVADRRAAEALRIRAYAEVMGLMTVMREERSWQMQRARRLVRWGLAAGSLLTALGVGALWAAGWLPTR